LNIKERKGARVAGRKLKDIWYGIPENETVIVIGIRIYGNPNI
jgi:hypothetical protein